MARTATCRVVFDMAALQRAAARSDETRSALIAATDRITSRANAMGAGTRSGGHGYDTKGTGRPRKGQGWLQHENSPAPVNGPQAAYDGNVRMQRDGYMGIVFTANHAAQVDNHRNNTLLKAKG